MVLTLAAATAAAGRLRVAIGRVSVQGSDVRWRGLGGEKQTRVDLANLSGRPVRDRSYGSGHRRPHRSTNQKNHEKTYKAMRGKAKATVRRRNRRQAVCHSYTSIDRRNKRQTLLLLSALSSTLTGTTSFFLQRIMLTLRRGVMMIR